MAQVRSHGQKYFVKKGKQVLHGFERKAKIMQAMEMLENQEIIDEYVKMSKKVAKIGHRHKK